MGKSLVPGYKELALAIVKNAWSEASENEYSFDYLSFVKKFDLFQIKTHLKQKESPFKFSAGFIR